MASNKNQHYVPRCYLRPFTIDSANLAINIYNIDRLRFIRRAAVKHQCSGDYFYGQSEKLEIAIQSIESSYAGVLREIFAPGYSLTDSHRNLLRRFWLFQHLRTEAASRRSVEMGAATAEVIGNSSPNFRMEMKEAVMISMSTFANNVAAVDDLKVCLLRNKTQTPFITSDDPAVLTNRWHFETNKNQGRSFGLASSGALLVLPISPRVLCLGYDGDVYSVPHNVGWVDVQRDADVKAFNQHQLLNCRANIFVRDSEHAQLVHEAFVDVASLRPKDRHAIRYAVFERREGDSVVYREIDRAGADDFEDAIVHSQAVHARPKLWPTQIAYRSKGSAYTDGSAAGHVRRAEALNHIGRALRKVTTP